MPKRTKRYQSAADSYEHDDFFTLDFIKVRRFTDSQPRPVHVGHRLQQQAFLISDAAFDDRAVNEHALVGGDVAKASAFVEHHDYKSLSDWIAKHNRYAALEARAILRN